MTPEGPDSGRHCDLYVDHFDGQWEAPKLIAVLSNEDAPDWGGTGTAGDLGHTTSRVSPDGNYLAFMSKQSLTGYDNEDITSKQPGERLDEEVFLYDAQDESLICASCDPSGARPQGVFDSGANGTGGVGEGLGLLVDRIGIWSEGDQKADHWLAGSIPGWTSIEVNRALYQSRYLSNSGRLFFDSPDHLADASTTAKEKVYEYEPDGVGSCQSEGGCVGLISSGSAEHEAAFLDASEDGDDVFFMSAEKLVPQDRDTNFNVYDAHVCEASSPCTSEAASSPPGCLQTPEGQCQAPPSASPQSGAPATATPSGPGNLASGGVLPVKVRATPKPPTRAQELAMALNGCRRRFKGKAKKRQRAACEAQAHKKWGPKPKAKKTETATKSTTAPNRSRKEQR